MGKKSLVAIIFSILFFNAYSQQKIKIKTEKNTFDERISFIAENNSLNTYTVYLNFPVLEGYRNSLPYNDNVVTVYPGTNTIYKIERIPKNAIYHYQWRYSYYVGKSFENIPDTNFIYLLPASNGKLLQGSGNVTSLEERLGQNRPESFHNYIFKFQLGDTVCAARSGIVYNTADDMKEGEKKEQTYTASRDKINIEQKDGTLAHYFFTAPVKILVEVGDKVTAGQPIAVFDTPSDKLNLLFSVNYLDYKKLKEYLLSNSSEEKKKEIRPYLPINFYLDKGHTNFINSVGRFKVLHPVNIITQEMSKRELKEFNH